MNTNMELKQNITYIVSIILSNDGEKINVYFREHGKDHLVMTFVIDLTWDFGLDQSHYHITTPHNSFWVYDSEEALYERELIEEAFSVESSYLPKVYSSPDHYGCHVVVNGRPIITVSMEQIGDDDGAPYVIECSSIKHFLNSDVATTHRYRVLERGENPYTDVSELY